MGMITKTPGPLGGRISFPNRKISTRSFSRQFFIAEAIRRKMKEISTVRKYISHPPYNGLSLSSGRLDYGIIVSEWNSVDKKKGRGVVAPAMIVSLQMVVSG
jgi:hypothetical protein